MKLKGIILPTPSLGKVEKRWLKKFVFGLSLSFLPQDALKIALNCVCLGVCISIQTTGEYANVGSCQPFAGGLLRPWQAYFKVPFQLLQCSQVRSFLKCFCKKFIVKMVNTKSEESFTNYEIKIHPSFWLT